MRINRSYCENYTYFTMDAVEFPEGSPAFLWLSSFRESPFQFRNNNNDNIHLSNSPIKLAEAGFQRRSDAISDEVFCKHCRLTCSGWTGESPLAIHRILRPTCPFLNPPSSELESEQVSHSHSHSVSESVIQIQSPFSQSESYDDHHRNLLPPSSFLSSSFIEDMLSSVNTNSSVRRQLFPNTNSNSQQSFRSLPPKLFRPNHSLGFRALYESFRLLTFLNPFANEAAVYAKCGFVFNYQSSHVMCVFCNVDLGEMKTNCSEISVEMLHESKAPTCPFVSCIDVGNITRECERVVRDKVRNNEFYCSLDHFERCGNREFVIKHPEFEEITSRIGTFASWPTLQSELFPAERMAECGFYCTGLRDSVRCYCCGVCLWNWSEDADPFIQHARASQFCLLMLHLKGKEFIDIAQNVELVLGVDYGEMTSAQDSDNESDSGSSASSTCSSPSSTCSSSSFSSSSSSSSSIGSPTLDMNAIKAATCQYTIEQIADAVNKFFKSSLGQYPNEQLLLGTLRAADENHKQMCQQWEEIICKDTVIQEKDTQLQAKDTQYQAVIQAKDRVIQDNDRGRGELQQLLVQKDVQLVQKDGIIEQKDVQLREIVEQKDEQLEQNREQLELKNREVEDLKRHLKSLQEELRRKEMSQRIQEDPVVSVHHSPLITSSPDGVPVGTCTVCLSSPSQNVFWPCGHVCCCDECLTKLQGRKCPVCRNDRDVTTDKVYVA